jgi:alkylation response protein AidB-like acyl-CoA dehydrogenase
MSGQAHRHGGRATDRVYRDARRSSRPSGADALEAVYRDAKIGEIYEGANEVQKWIIARTIFGREITG